MAQSLALHLNRALRKGEITGSHRPPARSLKVLATIDDPELDARYPDHTHFIDAQNPTREQSVKRWFQGLLQL